MNTKKTSASIIITAMIVAMVFAAIVMPASAACNSGSSNVLVYYASGGGGIPPYIYFTQTITQTTDPADVNASGLSNYDTLLIWKECSPNTAFTATQLADIDSWVNNGGKLIIWDTECPSVDYSWLVYPFTTNNPGAQGATGGTLTIAEENTLSNSSDPTSPYYIDTATILTATDAVGDANVMITRDPNWCLDMNATNVLQLAGPVHTYAHYGNGLIIWCGLDGDCMGSSAELRQVIINEFNQTWDNTAGTDPCGLPCAKPVVTPTPPCCVPVPVGPGPSGVTGVPLLTPFGAVLLIGLLAIVGAVGIRRRT